MYPLLPVWVSVASRRLGTRDIFLSFMHIGGCQDHYAWPRLVRREIRQAYSHGVFGSVVSGPWRSRDMGSRSS